MVFQNGTYSGGFSVKTSNFTYLLPYIGADIGI